MPRGESEDVIRDDVERRAEVLPALSTQDAAARAGEAVCDLERGDERHYLADELYDSFVIAEEVAIDLLGKGGGGLVAGLEGREGKERGDGRLCRRGARA